MALNGVIGKPGDVNQFVFKAEKGHVFDIHCYARRIRSPLDPVMYLGKKGGGAMLGDDDSVVPDSYFRFQAPETAEYVIWLVDQLGKGGPDYAYRIEVTPVAPSLTMSTAAEQIPLGTGVMSVAVPRGNRQAILIYGSRADFGGELNVGVGDLPAGVTVEAPVMAASQPVTPVLFSAKPDAAPGGSLATVTGKPVNEKLKVPSRFEQSSYLVLGQNNVNVWSRTVRPPGGRRHRGVSLHDRDRRAEGPAGPWRLDEPEGAGAPQAGLQGGDRGLSPLEPAGRRLGRGHRHPRREGRGRDSDERRRRRRAADLEDRGQRSIRGRLGADHGVFPARQPDDLAAVRQLRLPVGERRAGQGDGHGDQGHQGRRFPGRGPGDPGRPAEQGHQRPEEDHQGHHGPGLPHQDRQGLAGRQPHEPVLPARGDSERRADPAQPGQQHAPDRRAAAAEAERPGAAPVQVAAAPKPAGAPAKPLSRLEKLRLETKQAKSK